MTKEKYCRFAGWMCIITAIVLFGYFVGISIGNFIKAGKETEEIVSSMLLIVALMQTLYSFVAIFIGIIVSAILFALEKIIINTSYNKTANAFTKDIPSKD